jgi:DDE domain
VNEGVFIWRTLRHHSHWQSLCVLRILIPKNISLPFDPSPCRPQSGERIVQIVEMVAHSTILRWVTRYVPEFVKRWNRFSKAVGTSWRVDETYTSIKAKWHYLYRAVDKHGKTVGFLLRRDRGIAAAQAFFRKALASTLPRVPRKVTLDGHVRVVVRCA